MIIKTDYSRKLRHIQPVGATFFMTWHLLGAVSRAELRQIKQERETAIAELIRLNAPDLAKEIYLRQREAFRKYEEKLENNQNGPHFLKEPAAARAIMDQLHKLDGQYY